MHDRKKNQFPTRSGSLLNPSAGCRHDQAMRPPQDGRSVNPGAKHRSVSNSRRPVTHRLASLVREIPNPRETSGPPVLLQKAPPGILHHPQHPASRPCPYTWKWSPECTICCRKAGPGPDMLPASQSSSLLTRPYSQPEQIRHRARHPPGGIGGDELVHRPVYSDGCHFLDIIQTATIGMGESGLTNLRQPSLCGLAGGGLGKPRA